MAWAAYQPAIAIMRAADDRRIAVAFDRGLHDPGAASHAEACPDLGRVFAANFDCGVGRRRPLELTQIPGCIDRCASIDDEALCANRHFEGERIGMGMAR